MPDTRSAVCETFCISKDADIRKLKEEILKSIWLWMAKEYGESADPIDTRFDRVSEWLRENSENLELRMDFSDELSRHFPSGPAPRESNKIDVVVVTNSILKTLCALPTPENKASAIFEGTPRKSEAETSELVGNYLNRFDWMIKDYLSGPPWRAFWKAASSADPQTAQFIDSLKIPLVKARPELLLHGLGGNMVDQGIIDNIFSGSNQFLVNTSGSGKTCLLFEGLCRHWGFYFAFCAPSIRTYGSVDLAEAVNQSIPKSRGFKSPENLEGSRRKNAFDNNHAIAERRVHQVTMARILVFERFLKVAQDLRSLNGVNGLKRHWLFLQLFPTEILTADVFERLSFEILKDASDTYLLSGTSEVHEKLAGLQMRFGLDKDFFFVLDEAQILVEKLKGNFLSAQDESVQRPVLRPILSAWSGASIFPIIVSGTALSIDVVNEVVGSAVGKKIAFTLATKTGAFDDPKRQREYILRYMPRHLAESESGKELFKRTWNFAHGRHRFTASLLALLLRFSFQSPHRVLNAFVKSFCGFLPSDAASFVDNECAIDEGLIDLISFNLSKVRNDAGLLDLFSDVLYTWLIGRKPDLMTDRNKELVELGVARFVDNSGGGTSTIDEPLVLLALLHELNSFSRLSFDGNVKNALSEKVGRCENFEIFIAYYLACAFDNRRKICDIFHFGKDIPSWAKHSAQLVSLARAGGETVVFPFNLLEFYGSSRTIGFKCQEIAETVEWFEDPRSLMCFPDDYMGPDLVVFVRLASGEILAIMIQCKRRPALTLAPSVQKHACESSDYTRFYDHNNVRKDNGDAARESILSVLKRLNGPNLVMEADGWFQDGVPLVKVIASYPAVTQENLAPYHTTLDMSKCAEVLDKEGFLEALKESLCIKKRAAESDGYDSSSRKRQRIG